MFDHRVRVTFGEHTEAGAGLESDQVEELQVDNDMLELADTWSLRVPATPAIWDMSAPDQVVRVFIDDSQVLEGFIDERELAVGRDGAVVSISGRDKGGRLIDESAPLLTFGGQTLESVAAAIIKPWFTSLSVTNARNRALVRGRGRRLAGVSGEPLIKDKFNHRGEATNLLRKVQPGQSIAEVLSFFLKKAQVLGWSSADGREFIVGLPNYTQAPQFFFFVGQPGSARWQETNVESVTYRESVAERYSLIQAVGTNRGDRTDYGPNVTKRTAQVTSAGTVKSSALTHRKRLMVVDDDLKTPAQALARAQREMALRDARGAELTLVVAGFGQALGGDTSTPPALYAFDTIARVELEEVGLRGDWLITRTQFRYSREGYQTTLSLVPKGAELAFA